MGVLFGLGGAQRGWKKKERKGGNRKMSDVERQQGKKAAKLGDVRHRASKTKGRREAKKLKKKVGKNSGQSDLN